MDDLCKSCTNSFHFGVLYFVAIIIYYQIAIIIYYQNESFLVKEYQWLLILKKRKSDT